mgnify:CR=1 FL=1
MPRLRKAERLRRERISRGLRAYHREQRRLQEARAEGARRYWRRVKQAAGRHDLTIKQARRTIRLADQREIPVTEAALRVKPVPRIKPIPVELPLPPPPPRPPAVEYIPGPEQGEFAFNLKDVDEFLGLGVPERFRDRTVEADIVFTDRGRFQQSRTIEFDGGENDEDFWSNYYAAIREDYDEVIEETELDSADIGIQVAAMRAA